MNLLYGVPMKSILLVHGAWHGAWCWDLVSRRLTNHGITVKAVDLPFTGLENDSESVVEAIESLDGEIILVGHSYGGMVISKAGEGRAEVSHLVYLCAILLNEGESMVGNNENPHPSEIQIEVSDDLMSVVRPESIIPAFYADVPLDLAEKSITKLRKFPIDSISLGEGEAWRETQTTYVICNKDKAIHPDRQRQMANLADNVVEWDCAHSPFLSDPDLVSDLLINLANEE